MVYMCRSEDGLGSPYSSSVMGSKDHIQVVRLAWHMFLPFEPSLRHVVICILEKFCRMRKTTPCLCFPVSILLTGMSSELRQCHGLSAETPPVLLCSLLALGWFLLFVCCWRHASVVQGSRCTSTGPVSTP